LAVSSIAIFTASAFPWDLCIGVKQDTCGIPVWPAFAIVYFRLFENCQSSPEELSWVLTVIMPFLPASMFAIRNRRQDVKDAGKAQRLPEMAVLPGQPCHL